MSELPLSEWSTTKLMELLVVDLRAMCSAKGISLKNAPRKAEVVAVMEAWAQQQLAQGGGDGAGAEAEADDDEDDDDVVDAGLGSPIPVEGEEEEEEEEEAHADDDDGDGDEDIIDVGQPQVSSDDTSSQQSVSATTTTATATATPAASTTTTRMSTNSGEIKDKTNLIVNYIPSTLTEGQLRRLFEPFGECSRVKLMIDPHTGFSQGFGFIHFVHPEHAASALSALHGYEIGGKTLRVQYARPKAEVDAEEDAAARCKLYVAHLPLTFSEAQLRALFTKFGAVTEVTLLTERHDRSVSRGVGFVHMETPGQAEQAITALMGHVLPGGTAPLVVKIAEPKKRQQQQQQRGGGGFYQQRGGGGYGGRGGGRGGGGGYGPVRTSGGMMRFNPYGQAGAGAGGGGYGDAVTHTMSTAPIAPAPLLHNTATPTPAYGTPAPVAAPAAGGVLPYGGAAYAGAAAAAPGGALQQQGYGYGGAQQAYGSAAYGGGYGSWGQQPQQGGGGGGGGGVTPNAKGEYSLFVYGLRDEATEDLLRQLFGQCGNIRHAKVVKDVSTGRCKGYGFVHFGTLEEAQWAVSQMNGAQVADRTLQVSFRQSRQ